MAKFYMPVEVYEEPNAVMNHAADLKAFGEKALIVTGRHSAAANGSLADVTAALDRAGVAWCHFSEVEENPSVDTGMKARGSDADFQVKKSPAGSALEKSGDLEERIRRGPASILS